MAHFGRQTGFVTNNRTSYSGFQNIMKEKIAARKKMSEAMLGKPVEVEHKKKRQIGKALRVDPASGNLYIKIGRDEISFDPQYVTLAK